ncbi:hypothetical protein [Saccharopolyspora spinosa]|uniref:Uncharacterized protein n=1 Tax=Saccharopolyspora spinosa TaxID=60894 RepID=A0A2N3XRR4_SACSN|nr:hypothetical protein [Saccharopolyspora spinosa]PKW13332.1 hypothetical protein A8926_0852 [Saccharopolyspora spinosa]
MRQHPHDPYRILLAGDRPEMVNFALLLFGALFSTVETLVTWAALSN